MTENCIERNKRLNTEKKIADFKVKQKLDYDFKIKYAEARAWEFYNHPDVAGNCYVAVGGLDSITLLMFLRKIGINVPAVSVSILEDKSIQSVHRQLGVQALKPLKSKVQVIREFGWPVLSKEIAGKISFELEVPVPEIYGKIEQRNDGTLYTTKAQRTGCSMCGFGIQLEKRPHRFDILWQRDAKEWDFWMNKCCIDGSGNPYGWGHVLDYIGVEWRYPEAEFAPEQMILNYKGGGR